MNVCLPSGWINILATVSLIIIIIIIFTLAQKTQEIRSHALISLKWKIKKIPEVFSMLTYFLPYHHPETSYLSKL